MTKNTNHTGIKICIYKIYKKKETKKERKKKRAKEELKLKMVLTLQVVFAAKSRTKLKSNTNLKGRVLLTYSGTSINGINSKHHLIWT